jgi:hypothetical protein
VTGYDRQVLGGHFRATIQRKFPEDATITPRLPQKLILPMFRNFSMITMKIESVMMRSISVKSTSLPATTLSFSTVKKLDDLSEFGFK